jgi:hypothetical protein
MWTACRERNFWAFEVENLAANECSLCAVGLKISWTGDFSNEEMTRTLGLLSLMDIIAIRKCRLSGHTRI